MRAFFACALLGGLLFAVPVQAQSVGTVESASFATNMPVWRERWGFFLDFLDKPLFAIDGKTGEVNLDGRVTFKWEVPGEVMTRTVSHLDGTVLKVLTFRWDEANHRMIANLGPGDQSLSVQKDGSILGLANLAEGVLRTVFSLSGDSISSLSDYNLGKGWVLGAYQLMMPATEANMANAPQVAKVFASIYQNRKQTAELLAQMQGSRSDAEFEEYLAQVTKRNEERAQARQQREQESSESWSRVMGAVYNGLAQANQVAAASQAQSRAALGATVAQVNAAAAAERAAQERRTAQAAAEQQAARVAQATQMTQVAAAQQQADNRQAATQALAAQRKAEADASAARKAAEREARIAQQEREARANAAYQMRSFTASTANATSTVNPAPAATPAASVQPSRSPADNKVSVSANDSPASSKAPSRGQAHAWCMLKRDGDYWCNGPFQNGGWGKHLESALAMAGCTGGFGYIPTVGTGGQKFNCGRELRPDEQEMPLYDPFYNRDKKY